MPIKLSELAEESLDEIVAYYAVTVNEDFSESIENRILDQIDAINGFEKSIPVSELFPTARKLVISKLPYVAFIRENSQGEWEVIDIVHTSRKLPKQS
ncbi:MAG: type II toxin-antitoxin system RelE/ParE family toxin [Burkholderiaceae bacterium]